MLHLLVSLTLSVSALAPGVAEANAEATQTSNKCPRIFDATLYRNKPDLAKLGFEPALVMPVHLWYPRSKVNSDLPPRSGADKWMKSAQVRSLSRQRALLIPDIEHWPWRGDKAVVDASVNRFLTILAWMREEYEGPIGFYAVPPLRDYWRAMRGPDSPEYRAWQAENDAWAPLGSAVDAIFPSLYTFYDDLPGWERYAIENIREAKRLGNGKPVYAFLSPEYHSSNVRKAGQPVPGGMIRRQLEIVSEHGDGAVLFGGWAAHPPGPAWWNDEMEWWQVTKELLAKRPPGCDRP